MNAYQDALVHSRLALSVAQSAVVVAVLFLVATLLERKATALFRSQSFVTGVSRTPLEMKLGSWLWLVQLAYLAVIFAVASIAGEPLFTFLVGGIIAATGLAAAHNFRSTLHYRALALPGNATGSLSMSPSMFIRSRAHQCFEGSLVCLAGGFILPHAALLGGAFVLGAAGLGYWRKARL
jgi:hypothetical protein